VDEPIFSGSRNWPPSEDVVMWVQAKSWHRRCFDFAEKCQNHIVGCAPCAAKGMIIEMLIHPVKLGRGNLPPGNFGGNDAPNPVLDCFIFEKSTAGDKPATFSRGVLS